VGLVTPSGNAQNPKGDGYRTGRYDWPVRCRQENSCDASGTGILGKNTRETAPREVAPLYCVRTHTHTHMDTVLRLSDINVVETRMRIHYNVCDLLRNQ